MNNKLPDIKTKFTDWYQEVIYKAELADQVPVRGCVVIRPYGNDIWELIKCILDKKIKDTGHRNAIFPLLIPESFLKKEASHVEGFAPELAIVTHAGGKELSEPLVIRPTSETIIHYMFAQWIKSYRDLPLKINQWANVVRWEMRPRAFLRTTEFFWQEGHTAHQTRQEAQEEVELMLGHYKDLAENYLAIPVLTGQKSEGERFPGAEKTYTFEGVMPDGKALQMGTSHLLSQSFAHAFEMKFQDKQGQMQYPFLTSWGTTTRLIGAVVMSHGDQNGLVLPPKIAPIQVVIIPIFKSDDNAKIIIAKAKELESQLIIKNLRVFVDEDDQKSPGQKFNNWEIKGVPVRVEVGIKDIEKDHFVIANRVDALKEFIKSENAANHIDQLLLKIHIQMFERIKNRMNDSIKNVLNLDEMLKYEDGFAFNSGFCQTNKCEGLLKEHKLSIRCILSEDKSNELCFACDKNSINNAIIAKSY